jgi:hypothetical protein
MSKTKDHSHDHMAIPDHPHRGAATDIKLREGDCAVIFRKGDCPEFITNVPDGELEAVTSDNFLFSPYFMTDLLFAVYYGHPVMSFAMKTLAKLHATTGDNIELVQDGAKGQQPEEDKGEPGQDSPVVSVH